MKNTMFKIAGVKTDKEFYDKYPTEESFMAKHGAAFKKAQWGGLSMLGGSGGSGGSGGGIGGMISGGGIGGGQGGAGGIGGMLGGAGGGGGGFMDSMGGAAGLASTAGELIGGFQALKAQKEAVGEAKQMAGVSAVSADAAESIDVDARRQQQNIASQRYDAQMRPINGEELFPVNGRGTNILAAQSGATVSGRRMTSAGRTALEKKANEKAKAQKTSDSLFDAKIKAISSEPGFKEYMKNKKAQNGAEMPMQQLEPIDIGQVDDSIWKERQTEHYMNQMRDWRSKKTGVSPNRNFSQTSPEYMAESARIKKSWHADNKHLGPLPTLKQQDSVPNMQQGGFTNFLGGNNAGGQQTGGFADWMNSGNNGAQLSSIAGNISGNDAGSQIGGAAGGVIGTAVGGPIGGMIGKTLGKVAGGLIDRSDNKIKRLENQTKRNMQRMGNAGMAKSIQGQNARFMQSGGEVPSTGDVQALWGGDLEPISNNPNTAGGQTMMFDGQSHKEGGIGINYAGNKIEAEGGEPAIKMKHGGEGEGLVIFGDLPINKETAQMLGDPEAKGKRFKKYVENISDKENKANMKKEKATRTAAGIKPIEKFDRLKLDTQAIISKGTDRKLKIYAEQKENAALAQNAINQTAEELGADPKSIAQGKFKKASKSQLAKYGKYMSAQKGRSAAARLRDEPATPLPTRELDPIKYPPPFTSEIDGFRDNLDYNPDFSYDKSRFDLPPLEEIRANNPGGSSNDNWRITGGKGEGDRSGAALRGFGNQSQDKATGLYGGVDQKKYDRFKDLNSSWFDFENFDPKNSADVKRLQTEYNKLTSGNKVTVDGKFGDQTASMILGVDSGQKPVKMSGMEPVAGEVDVNRKPTIEDVPAKEKGKGADWLSALTPYIGRPSDAIGLDGNELYGEMAALSMNNVEPVYAQSYRPDLDVPYDISLQDQRNQVTAGLRSAQKLAGGNPAAQAMLQAQGYGQTQPINANEFRLNQGMKDQVYSKNRATLNDAKLKNIAIFDQQAHRQSQARSNTKEATLKALNSISDKYARNKLDQRTLKTYENMYNYRFGKDYRAQSLNDPLNLEAMQEAAGQNSDPIWSARTPDIVSKQQQQAIEEERRKQEIKDKAKQSRYGSLTKSFKNF
jgi:hypothetical protein